MVSLLVEEALEIANVLALSHKSRGGTVALYRSGQTITNPSAYSTINAYSTRYRIIQSTLLDLIGNGDGGKLAVFILASLLRGLNKLPYPQRHEEKAKLRESLRRVLSELKAQARPSDREAMLLVGDGDDQELNQKVCEAVELSEGGHISLEGYEGVGVVAEHTESLKADCLPLDLEGDRTLKGAMFAVFANRLTKFSEVQEALELMGTFAGRPLILVAPMISNEIRGGIIQNDKGGVLECVAVEAPRVTWAKEWLDDLCAYTGATAYETILKEYSPTFYGSAREVVLQHETMIIDPYDDHIDSTADRAEYLLRAAESIPHPHTQDLWRKRASALTGSLVRVRVGASTDAESRVRRNNAEKVILSMSDMYANGYVQGAIPALSPIECESAVLSHALKAPWRVLCHNLKTYTHDPAVLCKADHPFPLGRLCSLLERVVSIAETLSTVEVIIPPRRSR